VGGRLSTERASGRLATLRAFVAQRPRDPFPRYALGMELLGSGELQAAWDVLQGLIGEFPDYIASYSAAGQVLVALGRQDEARLLYRTGIEVCSRKGDDHACASLEDALAAIE
jgi:predicted Zn-dependent protease